MGNQEIKLTHRLLHHLVSWGWGPTSATGLAKTASVFEPWVSVLAGYRISIRHIVSSPGTVAEDMVTNDKQINLGYRRLQIQYSRSDVSEWTMETHQHKSLIACIVSMFLILLCSQSAELAQHHRYIDTYYWSDSSYWRLSFLEPNDSCWNWNLSVGEARVWIWWWRGSRRDKGSG